MGGAEVADHHLDIDRAVQSFLHNCESLTCLPLISDAEMTHLFGDEVASALVELEHFNRQEKICRTCGGECCRLVSCELYLPELGCCPVQGLRPVLCRMHFCKRYAGVYPWLVKEIGDIFLESLIEAGKAGYKKVFLFDSPPLRTCAPDMVDLVLPNLSGFRQGSAGKKDVLESIEAGLRKFIEYRAVGK